MAELSHHYKYLESNRRAKRRWQRNNRPRVNARRRVLRLRKRKRRLADKHCLNCDIKLAARVEQDGGRCYLYCRKCITDHPVEVNRDKVRRYYYRQKEKKKQFRKYVRSMKNPQEKEVIEFLRESNAIEGVRSEQSLKDAQDAWVYLISRPVLTVQVILRTHAILMRNQDLRRSEIGAFRTVNVYVGGNMMMDPKLIPGHILMEFSLGTMRKSPKPDWKALHVLYEKIHPFVDGNGRTGRMFMNWTRLRRCNLPLLIIHEGDEQQEYYKWFRE